MGSPSPRQGRTQQEGSKVQGLLKTHLAMNRQKRQQAQQTNPARVSRGKQRQSHNLARAQNHDRSQQHARDDEVASALRSDNRLGLINVVNALAYAANALVTFGVGTFGLFGLATTAQVSAIYQTIVTPASWTFLIWVFIFAFQMAWAIAQLLGDFRNMMLVTCIGWNYVAVCVCQIAWTLTFCLEIIWGSMIAMVGILLFLFRIFQTQSNLQAESYLYWALKFPMTLHYAWIIAATVLNINVLLVSLGVSDTNQYYVALASISALMLVGCATSDLVVLLVLAWATVSHDSAVCLIMQMLCILSSFITFSSSFFRLAFTLSWEIPTIL